MEITITFNNYNYIQLHLKLINLNNNKIKQINIKAFQSGNELDEIVLQRLKILEYILIFQKMKYSS